MKNQHAISIIGAGIGGIFAGIQLLKHGIDDFVIFEKGSSIGGTWRDNTYPGCACDVPAVLYSIASEQKVDWKNKFAKQEEILDYVMECVQRYQLLDKIKIETGIIEMSFEESSGAWHLKTDNDEEFFSKFMISATGPLNVPRYPESLDLGNFKGIQFHSSAWNHSVDLKDKKVVVVGTGASAIQFIPEIAPLVKELHILQRTPPWILAKWDRKVKNWEIKCFQLLPFLQRWYRSAIFWYRESLTFGMIKTPYCLKYLEYRSKRKMKMYIKNKQLREKLTPKYRLGCKRTLLSNNYYPCLNRENVFLHDQPINELFQHSVKLKNGEEINADVIIYGTGFYPSSAISRIRISGIKGKSLIRTWLRNGPKSYLGLMASGFPNLFFLLGPNTGLGSSSVILMMEAQMKFITNLLVDFKKRKWNSVDVSEERQEAYNEYLLKKHKRTVWNVGGCSSWFLSKGKNWALWPGFVNQYKKKTSKIDKKSLIFQFEAKKEELQVDH